MNFMNMDKCISFLLSLVIILLAKNNVHAQLPLDDSLKIIYIVSHGWHTGIIINKNDLPDTLWPPNIDFSPEDSLEIGWGDKDFYMSDDFNYLTALKAVIWPTESVLHVVAFNELISNYFISNEIIRLKVTPSNYQLMCTFILESFQLDSSGKAIPAGKGLYGNSQFFLGKKKYYYPHTCNVWTAKALYKAGLHIYPQRYQFAKELISYLKKFGKIINKPDNKSLRK